MAASDKVNVAVIGLGGRGRSHMNEYAKLPDANIVALCDVNQAALERGQAQVEKATGAKPKGYEDMRKVFDDKNVQAVSMPLPNHWHALATIWACQAGKDVYVEKPACHNVYRRPEDGRGRAQVQPHGADRVAEPQHGAQDSRPCSCCTTA